MTKTNREIASLIVNMWIHRSKASIPNPFAPEFQMLIEDIEKALDERDDEIFHQEAGLTTKEFMRGYEAGKKSNERAVVSDAEIEVAAINHQDGIEWPTSVQAEKSFKAGARWMRSKMTGGG